MDCCSDCTVIVTVLVNSSPYNSGSGKICRSEKMSVEKSSSLFINLKSMRSTLWKPLKKLKGSLS